MEKENQLVGRPLEERRISIWPRRYKVTLARLVFKLVLRKSFFSFIIVFATALFGLLGHRAILKMPFDNPAKSRRFAVNNNKSFLERLHDWQICARQQPLLYSFGPLRNRIYRKFTSRDTDVNKSAIPKRETKSKASKHSTLSFKSHKLFNLLANIFVF